MVRYTRDEGHIHIAWGHDEFLGYFFSLYDKRLRSKGDASSEVKMICSHVSEDDTGAYLNLTTGLGIGKKVSRSTMFTFMVRYGIDPMIIETEPENFHPESFQPETIGPKTIIKTAGGETPEMRIDPKYIEARKQRLRDQIIRTAESGGRTTVVVGRLDRTIQELSRDYNVPITRASRLLFPNMPGGGLEIAQVKLSAKGAVENQHNATIKKSKCLNETSHSVQLDLP
ncbi:hypothetical protein BGZ68_005192 [Mortierella alpina]|nr:hypothetical protein BGZ68_005192 [Mortierella alpina]